MTSQMRRALRDRCSRASEGPAGGLPPPRLPDHPTDARMRVFVRHLRLHGMLAGLHPWGRDRLGHVAGLERVHAFLTFGHLVAAQELLRW
jgi:hypothetical protein